ncbi:MAG: DNA topoisomerase IB [Chloroflexales bacterium]|nr:DNA topoisomerase IB [Chloroflexales bacterium]
MLATASVASAEAAGLHYVSDSLPGIRRRRAGSGFSYSAPDGSSVKDADTLERIRSLAIPPAYRDVWICPDPDGHIQATARDVRGRKQYRYHPRWQELRGATKYDRMLAFGQALPLIRVRTDHDLKLADLTREKVLATVVRLLETTLIRVGNDEYARQNSSFGLTTMRDRHVKVEGASIRFRFRGKSGIDHTISLTDRKLAAIVKRCQDVPGYELFQYVDANGPRQRVNSNDVNAYIKEITGQDFTAKDFRTWAGTLLAAQTLGAMEPATSATQARRRITQAMREVSERLGNTPSVCRKCYVHPAVVAAYSDSTLAQSLADNPEHTKADDRLRPEELAVLHLLEQRPAATPADDCAESA